MFEFKMPDLNIGNLKAKLPIIQGGMGVGISLAGLASAVANEGGIGVISSVGLNMLKKNKINPGLTNRECLRNEIRLARKLTGGLLGVNIMVAVTDFDELVKVSLEEEIDLIFMGAGLPLKIPENTTLDYLLTTKTKIVPIVSSARATKVIFDTWSRKFNHIPDAVVVEGPKAGGHLGFKLEQIFSPEFKLEKLIVETKKALEPYVEKYQKDIPVIAAGGIFSGRDIYRIIKMGADGVQMGTRFVATDECDAADEFKESYIKSKRTDIEIIKSPVGLPGRALTSKFLNDVKDGLRKPFKCPWKCLKTCDISKAPYCIAKALLNAQRGLIENGFAFAGANAYRIKKIIPVKKLVGDLATEFKKAATLEIQFLKKTK